MKIICDKCNKELNELGALIFSPPLVNTSGCVVYKYHVCVKCYYLLIEFLQNK